MIFSITFLSVVLEYFVHKFWCPVFMTCWSCKRCVFSFAAILKQINLFHLTCRFMHEANCKLDDDETTQKDRGIIFTDEEGFVPKGFWVPSITSWLKEKFFSWTRKESWPFWASKIYFKLWLQFKPVFRAFDKTGGGGGWWRWLDDFAGRGHVPLVAPWAFKPCWALYSAPGHCGGGGGHAEQPGTRPRRTLPCGRVSGLDRAGRRLIENQ